MHNKDIVALCDSHPRFVKRVLKAPKSTYHNFRVGDLISVNFDVAQRHGNKEDVTPTWFNGKVAEIDAEYKLLVVFEDKQTEWINSGWQWKHGHHCA